MKELNLHRVDIDGTREPDIDFWALKELTGIRETTSQGPLEANPQILIDQNNIYLNIGGPEELEAFKAHLAKNGVEISEEVELICG